MHPEARISLLPREGSVSGAQKGPRLPALEGLGPSGSPGSILSEAALLRLPESVNLQTNKQSIKPVAQLSVAGAIMICRDSSPGWRAGVSTKASGAP